MEPSKETGEKENPAIDVAVRRRVGRIAHIIDPDRVAAEVEPSARLLWGDATINLQFMVVAPDDPMDDVWGATWAAARAALLSSPYISGVHVRFGSVVVEVALRASPGALDFAAIQRNANRAAYEAVRERMPSRAIWNEAISGPQ